MEHEAIVGSPCMFDCFVFSKLRDTLSAIFSDSRDAATYYARRGDCFPNDRARQYRLTFRNVLRVHQGKEYATRVVRCDEEITKCDVRWRLIEAGYDEYRDGLVEYVAFSNRIITSMGAVKHMLRIAIRALMYGRIQETLPTL